jgi:multidrug efflux pump subunit AcrA (membrane-fusion protein)
VAFESGNSFVWVKNSGSFEKRAVKTGPQNDVEVVVLSGLQEGDFIRRVAAEQP